MNAICKLGPQRRNGCLLLLMLDRLGLCGAAVSHLPLYLEIPRNDSERLSGSRNKSEYQCETSQQCFIYCPVSALQPDCFPFAFSLHPHRHYLPLQETLYLPQLN